MARPKKVAEAPVEAAPAVVEHKEPGDRKHFWEHPASTHNPYPDAPAAPSGDYPAHVHKLDGSWKEVRNDAELAAAVADGWLTAADLHAAKA